MMRVQRAPQTQTPASTQGASATGARHELLSSNARALHCVCGSVQYTQRHVTRFAGRTHLVVCAPERVRAVTAVPDAA